MSRLWTSHTGSCWTLWPSSGSRQRALSGGGR
nr:MAG TPA: hypothetical protein [Caudoviricetes sp.]